MHRQYNTSGCLTIDIRDQGCVDHLTLEYFTTTWTREPTAKYTWPISVKSMLAHIAHYIARITLFINAPVVGRWFNTTYYIVINLPQCEHLRYMRWANTIWHLTFAADSFGWIFISWWDAKGNGLLCAHFILHIFEQCALVLALQIGFTGKANFIH